MKKKIVAILPFAVMPILIPVYCVLDNIVFVEVFGCGCVPSAQTNMLNIPFNANDLRLVVFSLVTLAITVWGIFISKRFSKRAVQIIYCLFVLLINVMLTIWVVKTFMWA